MLDEFLRAIAASPDDDTPRFACADYLEEIGEATWAEFIRLQIELHRTTRPGLWVYAQERRDQGHEFEITAACLRIPWAIAPLAGQQVDILWWEPNKDRKYTVLNSVMGRIDSIDPRGFGSQIVARGTTFVFADSSVMAKREREYCLLKEFTPKYCRLLADSLAGPGLCSTLRDENIEIRRGFPFRLRCNPSFWENTAARILENWPLEEIGFVDNNVVPSHWLSNDWKRKYPKVKRWGFESVSL